MFRPLTVLEPITLRTSAHPTKRFTDLDIKSFSFLNQISPMTSIVRFG